jgi:hypothetical protein
MLTPEERRQRELVDGLRTDIRALAHSLDVYAQALKTANASRDATYQQAQEARTRVVVLEQIQTERNATDAKSKKKEWSGFEKGYLAVQILLLLATAGAFGAAYWYARIADIQKNTMISQTPIINKTAEAANAAITQSRNQFRQDQRPYLWVANGKSGVPAFNRLLEPDRAGFLQAYWDISVFNFGKTPAYHVKRQFSIQVGNRHPMSRSFGEGGNNPPTLIAATGQADIRVLSSPNIIQMEIDAIQMPHSHQTISIRGTITYADSHGVDYESGVCLSRLDSGVIQYCDGNYIK